MRKAIAFGAALLLCLAGCQADEADPVEVNPAKTQPTQQSRRELNAAQGKSLGGKQQETGAKELVRSDAEGLVEIRIEGGEASAKLNIERFDELYDYSERYGVAPHEGTIAIAGLSGEVKDACIAQIPELDLIDSADFVAPSIFLLMEDGSVEWVLVDYHPLEPQNPRWHSMGPLKWIEDIASLSYESDGEGIGEMTVYAEDGAGMRYDLRIPAKFMELYTGHWACDLPDEGQGTSGYYGVLRFSQDGSVTFEKGWIDGGEPLRYTGTFSLSIAEDGAIRPGMLTLDLYLDSTANAQHEAEIHGQFFADMQRQVMLELWLAHGDPLHADETVQMQYGHFWLGENPLEGGNAAYEGGDLYHGDPYQGGAVDDYAQYLIDRVYKANEMVTVYGMSVLITDEYTELAGDACRNIWLGTDHGGQFVREIRYAISDGGNIFEYDPIVDDWIVQWVPD